jgi:hypothetical protein
MSCTIIIILASMASTALGNHPHHHHHHLQQQPTPLVISSFSHQLPGTNSYMSVTRYFGSSSAPPALSENHNQTLQDNFHPWNPRFKVAKIEATDDEWEEQLREVFEESGLLGGQRIIRQVPKGLVNLNYDIHICVHMGTELLPEETAYPPTALSYPADDDKQDKLHALVLLDADLNKLHWLVINIPGAKVHRGDTITAYAGPNPDPGSGTHRYVVLVMEQHSQLDQVTDPNVLKFKTQSSCDVIEEFDFQNLRQDLNLSEPVAVNYFTQKFNAFVDNINGHCLPGAPIQAHPLYK